MRFPQSGLLLCGAVCAAFAVSAPGVHGQSAATPSSDAKSPAQPDSSNQGPHYPTNEDLRHLKALGGPLLSPDGKLVLFTVTEATADGGKSHLWLAPATGSDKARQITFCPPTDQRGERGAQWAPDGSAIYFLAKRGEHTQLFRLDMRGGEAAPYDLKIAPPVDDSKEKNAIPPANTAAASAADKSSDKKPEAKPADKKPDAASDTIPIDVSGYAPSPDGKWLAVWAHDPETPGEKKQKDAKADVSWVDHETHGTRLYLAALKDDGSVDGALRQVGVNPDVHGAVWAPAADRLAVMTEGPNEVSDLGPAGAAWLVNANAPQKPLKLDGVPATVGGGAAWRPDGGEIVFAANTPEDAPPGYDELFALPIDANGVAPGPARRISAGFAGQANGVALFFPGNGSVVALAGVGMHMTPIEIALEGKTPPKAVDLGASVVSGLNTNRKQTGWVWLADSGGKPPVLCYAAHLGDPCSAVNTPETEPANLISVKPELVHWQNGGLTIEGLLYLPQTATTSAKVPLIVDVHGGPHGAWEDRNDLFAAFMVGHGWAVLRPNPRGSSNYGTKFSAANKNDLGGGDYQDIMTGVDAMLAKYPLDPNRLALMGYSYGGEMAGFVEGKTDRFKAIISGAPVIDQFSEYGTEGGSWYDRWYYGKPWEHFEDAWRQSPLSGAARAKTPFMLLQGQSDHTDPLGQSEEMYRALRQEGVPVDLVTYPRDDHGALGGAIFGRPGGEPWHGYDARQRIVEFIEKGFATAKP
ncbi:MAG: prolyl oligopeptidase family serine peptidase [Terracidiphilus sp.]|jgi:dipeptidyl aminopeptidase/acylaminoacyl peptidase